MNMNMTLTFANGSLRGCRRRYEKEKSILIGRARECDLAIPTHEEFVQVSRRHCLLKWSPPEVWVRDLESTNGTFVNGVQVGDAGHSLEVESSGGVIWRRLKSGDELRLGRDTHLRVTVSTEPANADSTRGERRCFAE